MSMAEYNEACQLGQKEYRARVSRGEYPYLQSLDRVLRFAETQEEINLGLVEIPVTHIVGTKSDSRKNAFAANFMPLLEESSEFAAKWSSLADAHLEEGIRDPIVACEFMNRFYVVEGNKRASVMKFYGAVRIAGMVTRILPTRQDTVENKVYFDFLDFYALTKINDLWFSQPGRFKALLKALGKADRPWSDKDRAAFSLGYYKFRRAFKALGGDRLPGTTGDALLAYLQLHEFASLRRESDARLRENLTRSWNELAAYSIPEPVELALNPVEQAPSILARLLNSRGDVLRAAFLYERSPETSAWTHAHDEGRKWAEENLGGRVVTTYRADVCPEQGAEAILQEMEQGADIVFTTSPKLLPACLKAAATAPEGKILNCSVYSPHPSIRTYYGRMFEVKFLAGLIAGAMTHTHRVGYMADYPIYGATAAINAFALGVRMTDPWAQVFVEWRAQRATGLWESLTDYDVDMISGQDARSPVDPWRAYGLYRLTGKEGRQIATAAWDWGKFYMRILKSVHSGDWKKPPDMPKAINYWWGLSAGVVDLHTTDEVPRDTMRLVTLLREAIVAGELHLFEGKLVAQDGRLVQESGRLSPDEIVKMDWLAENVVGSIPAPDTLDDEARELVRLQGVRGEDEGERG